ncbi:MAG: bifunctional UDP-N-acetylglucosamine diphosphorylase/glucosamine-1-phosphate N-acetyltransferase GlmU [Chloroflexota bacterium]
MKVTPVILAAGQGTRMKSSLPKVLHPILGHPLAWYALEAVHQVTDEKPVMVVGHGADQVRQQFAESVRFVVQELQLGTGHAVMQAETLLRGQSDTVLVTYADMPLICADTLRQIIDLHQSHDGPVTMLTVNAREPRGFGRILRDAGGNIIAILEEAQATPEQRAIRELNPGVYCFRAGWLWDALHRIKPAPQKGEYYLTDLVEMAAKQGHSIRAVTTDDEDQMIGVNTRVHLAEAAAALQRRIHHDWMLAGVTIVDPSHTYIEPDVSIGQDTTIWPATYLRGKTVIGRHCEIGPNAIVQDSQLGNGVKVLASVIEKAVLEDDVDIGPFGHLRKGAHLAQGVHLGNFGEVKNSYLGQGTKMGHFSYIGDAQIGEGVNIGAGTITCNFDMAGKKNPTEIGAGAFIGSDTMLVAPVKIGKGSATGSGSVVTKNVPDQTLVVGVPARAIRKLEK